MKRQFIVAISELRFTLFRAPHWQDFRWQIRVALLLPLGAFADVQLVTRSLYDSAATEAHSEEIQAGAVTVTSVAPVLFLSASSVRLTTGFHARAGSHFEARIAAIAPSTTTPPLAQSTRPRESVAIARGHVSDLPAYAVTAAEHVGIVASPGAPLAFAGSSGLSSLASPVATSSSVSSAVADAAGNASRLVNLSLYSALSIDTPQLTVGFVISRNGKILLVRGVGPTLAQFGIARALVDPRLTVFAGGVPLARNDDWGSEANAMRAVSTAAQVGAFPLAKGSADAALLAAFDGGAYSAQVSGPSGASGILLFELHDANPTAASRLISFSARAPVGMGDNSLVAGFVIAGAAKKTLLIRAIGPTLAAFGVSGALADPKLDVFHSKAATPLASNDNWGGREKLASAFAAFGAFALRADTKDAALLVTLDPGAYSVEVSGVKCPIGEALVEIYDLP